jgi:hypothetical protein
VYDIMVPVWVPPPRFGIPNKTGCACKTNTKNKKQKTLSVTFLITHALKLMKSVVQIPAGTNVLLPVNKTVYQKVISSC